MCCLVNNNRGERLAVRSSTVVHNGNVMVVRLLFDDARADV